MRVVEAFNENHSICLVFFRAEGVSAYPNELNGGGLAVVTNQTRKEVRGWLAEQLPMGMGSISRQVAEAFRLVRERKPDTVFFSAKECGSIGP
jgi:hypothetical protein